MCVYIHTQIYVKKCTQMYTNLCKYLCIQNSHAHSENAYVDEQIDVSIKKEIGCDMAFVIELSWRIIIPLLQ